MDLFLAAGIEPDGARRGGRPGRFSPGSRRAPLFSPKVVDDAIGLIGDRVSAEQQAVARAYAELVRNPKFAVQKETSVRSRFFEDILVKLLGYRRYDAAGSYSFAEERSIRGGAVDIALGHFGPLRDEIVAPLEMKGPATVDLDAIPPGRGLSPVQQAWDYAIDAPGSRFVLVSNCIEVRLYGFGRGRDAYELFDLRKLDDPRELDRLWVILSADRLLGGATEALLRETENAYKTITAEFYEGYHGLRQRLLGFLADSADGPSLARLDALEAAQKLLDRILFIAFAQRTDLLGRDLLKRAIAAKNPFDKKPAWFYIANLFRFLAKDGDHDLDITPYNGGLFAPDPAVDAVTLPDALTEDLVALGDWDYRRDVPVSVLGHIFEQSVTDIEKERAESAGLPAPAVAKRKREGIVYTPDMVTRFLVDHTIGVTLAGRYSALLQVHAGIAASPRNGDTIPWREGEASEKAFWREYLAVLRSLTVVDPACGSGAFLAAAFDVLAAEYDRVAEKLADLGEVIDFDPMDEILTRNLHGVDLNAESVEITRLSLWLRTARRKHRLQSLEATIKAGDSLIDDPAYTDRPFDWRAAFPDVFAAGGFDIVIGNPPYVRMELIKPVKPYLEKHFTVAADRADLYAYFYERGVDILKPGGRLGYISSSTFFRTGSGEKLRTFLGDGVAVETVVDFGDLQIFEGVTTYPAIVTLRKNGEGGAGDVAFLNVRTELPTDLGAAFREGARSMRRARLGSGSWRLEEESLARLRDKISTGRKTLGEVYGPPLYGIKTGFNDAFIIDTETRDRLIAADPKSAELLKPFLRGENIKRWRVEPEGLFVINTPKGKVDIDDYLAIRDWLLRFRPELEKRATKQAWFELQQAQLAYQPAFGERKIVYLDIANEPPFAYDDGGTFIDCTVFMIRHVDKATLAFLNSKVAWFQWLGQTPIASGGYIRLKQQYVSPTYLPETNAETRRGLETLGEVASQSARRRFELQANLRHRLRDLASPGRVPKLMKRLHDWWTLDFTAFRKAVKRSFGAEIPVKERDQWERYLAENAAMVKALGAQIADAEREIDAIVYRLFDLTPDEIRLLEDALQGQHH